MDGSPPAEISIKGTMMRIAIAGCGGLAQIFARHIDETAHTFIMLSRVAQPELEALGYQVSVVDYDDQSDLQYTLRGIDLVISTVSGVPQINLIDAAAHSAVSRFVPAEFEGPPARRAANDPLDRGRDHHAIMERLRYWKTRGHRMQYTIFSCGVFYERFARGGLASLRIGASTGVYYQGTYIMDVEHSTALIVERNNQPINLCLTSVHDVAKFLVAALDLDLHGWQTEFRMCGDRMTMAEVLQWGEYIKGGALFSTDVIQAKHLGSHIEYSIYEQDYAKAAHLQELMATEQRRYDFTQPNLNALVNVVPETFGNWLSNHWAGV